MPRRVLMVLALAGGLVSLTGCPPAYPKCESDDHCKDKGEVCFEGQCQECSKDEHCKEGFVCEANKCMPKPECASSADCGSGRKCSKGACVAQDHCQSDQDCGEGSCRNNRCVAAGSCQGDADCPSGQECRDGACQGRTSQAGEEKCDWSPVRFAFNEYSLDADSRDRLSRIAECAKKEGGKLTLEGHADERGTEEYNLQLSNKRAASVKKYLTDLGVKPTQLDAVGFGENRPATGGHDESAWAENRRVEFRR